MLLVLFVALVIFAKEAKIFIVNLYSEPVDIRLGGSDNPIVSKKSLKSFGATRLTYTKKYGDYTLYFKLSSSDEWYQWADDNGEIWSCPVRADKNYCILIGTDGYLNYFTLTEDNKKGPKVCFLNGSDKRVKRMELSKSWNYGVQAYCVDFNPNDISNFVTFSKGSYSMFWQFPFQILEDYYYANKDLTGKEIFNFVDGEYDLFLIYTKDDAEYGTLYEITPRD